VLVEVGMGVGPVGFDVEQQALIWAMWRRGDAIREMERTLGETLPRIRRYLRESGGIPPIPRRRRVGHLSLDEREEISRGIAAGLSGRTIVGTIACSCGRHLTWRCECGAVTYGPALGEGCSLLNGPARVR
jgi:hypothetical protein